MPDYRRYQILGGAYFFTVNPLEHYPNDLLVGSSTFYEL
jgi:putative transposase